MPATDAAAPAGDDVRRLADRVRTLVRDAAHVPAIHALPAKHYLQEEQAPAISELVARHAARV